MKTIGLDIGTTKICGILIDSQSGELLHTLTRNNDSSIHTEISWEKSQNPRIILAHCQSILDEFRRMASDIKSIGITGQMHGILYIDASGSPVSPLYTWQDERGNQIFSESLPQSGTQSGTQSGSDSETYASYLTRATGYPMATGYGLTTHFYMMHNRLIPDTATVFCSIQDYVAMTLVNARVPLVHVSDAASFGLFDREQNQFDKEALKKVRISPSFLPPVTDDTRIVGQAPGGIYVSAAIGDNQASFLGSVCDADAILVNVGTGSQVSVRVHSSKSAAAGAPDGIQARPFADGDNLCVGSPLCGGYSYAVLRDFFIQTIDMFGGTNRAGEPDLFRIMDEAASRVYSKPGSLSIDTRFRGTRENPAIRGSIANITPDNLTPGHLCLGVMRGICNELFSLYMAIPSDPDSPPSILVGSGNGIRSSPLMQQIFTDTFGLTLKIPLYREEAAYGAALFSLAATGVCRSLQEAQNKIRYQ